MPEKQFAKHCLGPDGKPLQIWPPPKRADFDSADDFFEYLDAISRFNNNMPPKPRPVPEVEGRIGEPGEGLTGDQGPTGDGGISRKVGIRLAPHDHELLVRLAGEHAVAPSTMARILVAKGVRSAFQPGGDE